MAPRSDPAGSIPSANRASKSKTDVEQGSKKSSPAKKSTASASRETRPPTIKDTRPLLAAGEYDGDNITLAAPKSDTAKDSQSRVEEVASERAKPHPKAQPSAETETTANASKTNAPALLPPAKTTATGTPRRKGVAYPVKRVQPKARTEYVTDDEEEGEEEEEVVVPARRVKSKGVEEKEGKGAKGGRGVEKKRKHRDKEDEGEEDRVKGSEKVGKEKAGKEKGKTTKKKGNEDETPTKKLKTTKGTGREK